MYGRRLRMVWWEFRRQLAYMLNGIAWRNPCHRFRPPRGWAGPNLLAMILFEQFGQYQPLNRHAARYAREGLPLSLSILAVQVGTCTAAADAAVRPAAPSCHGGRAAA
jgi:transposase